MAIKPINLESLGIIDMIYMFVNQIQSDEETL